MGHGSWKLIYGIDGFLGIEYWKDLRRVFKAGFLRSRKGGVGLEYWKSLKSGGLCRCWSLVGGCRVY